MKTAVSAFLILALLIGFSYYISYEQEEVLVPIYYKLESLNNSINKEENLKECLKLLQENDFIIKLGIPTSDYDKVHILMEKALIYLDDGDSTIFSATAKECLLQLKSLLEHCDLTLNNIL